MNIGMHYPMAARAELSIYQNQEQKFADPDVWKLTDEGSESQMPTWQFWKQEGKIPYHFKACQKSRVCLE